MNKDKLKNLIFKLVGNVDEQTIKDALFFIDHDLIDRNDCIATTIWVDADIRDRLEDLGYSPSDENVANVVNSGLLKNLGDCTDEDWWLIDLAITETLGEL